MNLILRRSSFTDEGIFGMLFDERNNKVCVTLEHSYGRVPKLAPGVYTCRRGMHTLHKHLTPFEAFEVQGVPDFAGKAVTGILFHIGNFNRDSEGCILLGTAFRNDMIIHSEDAFKGFMTLQATLDEFQLTVS